MFISLFVMAFLMLKRPLETFYALKVEIANESTLLLLAYLLLCFTDLIPLAEDQYEIGYLYIFISLSNITGHILMMLFSTLMNAKSGIKKFISKRRRLREMKRIKELPLRRLPLHGRWWRRPWQFKQVPRIIFEIFSMKETWPMKPVPEVDSRYEDSDMGDL